MKKQAIVIHSGGLDSSLCLALAMKEYGKENVLSLSFQYGQRHSHELAQAAKICATWEVDHQVLSIECLQAITKSALIGKNQTILSRQETEEGASNTLVLGRNGLMAHLGAIHAQNLGAHCIYMGIIEVDAKEMGYRDCTREYMDLKEKILRLDLNDPSFKIHTPLVNMTKKETLELSFELGILKFLLQETISCYQGIPKQGCRSCPTCQIRNLAIREFLQEHRDFALPFEF